MKILTTTQDLDAACRHLAKADFATIDTEFIRDTTYWPQLCLVQMAGPDAAFIADPLSPGLDLAPFYDLLRNRDVVKVFHAARQDIEIFYHDGGVVPAPLFDTQVAAMACGFGDSVGYDSLVKSLAHARIDKSSRFTDWARRPLAQRQLDYALADVTHLRTLYHVLRRRLEESGRTAWLEEEMAVLTSPATYNLDPREAWRRLKLRPQVRRHLGVLIEVAAWREIQAQTRNVPRSRVMRDDVLFEIVTHQPQSTEELDNLRGLPKGFSRSAQASGLLEAVAKGMQTPKNALPQIEKNQKNNNKNTALLELLKVLLKLQCERHNVAQKLVASVTDLEKIAADHTQDIPALKGWRYDVFGKTALKLKNGELALSVKDHEITLVPLTSD